MRQAEITRNTKETQIALTLNLDGSGQGEISTGVGFLDHMLTHLSRHGHFDLRLQAQGDLEIDPHHTVEDVGICLGKALLDALQASPESSIPTRFGHAVVPMDEALAEVAIDLSGRPFLAYDATFPGDRVGEFDVELVEEFFRALAMNARMTLHIVLRQSNNVHHAIEGIFKAFARSLSQATAIDTRLTEVPSTKGMLER